MAKKAGYICILAGIVLILSSVGLYAYFEAENKRAENNSADVVNRIVSAADSNTEADYSDNYSEMVVKTIKGKDYVGYISIPVLDIDVPIMANCNYNNLKIAPCRYFGWAGSENMVIAGHNYKCHFGRLSQLKPGDKITFTDMCNKVYNYQVADIEILPPSATEEMTESDWALTLYTCTYSSKNRITIRCSEVK